MLWPPKAATFNKMGVLKKLSSLSGKIPIIFGYFELLLVGAYRCCVIAVGSRSGLIRDAHNGEADPTFRQFDCYRIADGLAQ